MKVKAIWDWLSKKGVPITEPPIDVTKQDVFQVTEPRKTFYSGQTLKAQEAFWNNQANWCLQKETEVFFGELCSMQQKLYKDLLLASTGDAAHYQARLRQLDSVLLYPQTVVERLVKVRRQLSKEAQR
jgi:hypothetical protein